MTAIGTILAGVGALGCLWFVLRYHLLTGGDWRHNPAGRHLMAFTANLGVLLGLIVVNRLSGDYPGRVIVTMVLFAALVGQIVWRLVLLERAQR